MVACAAPLARRRRGAVERVVERVAHPLDHALEHRDVDPPAAAGAAALDQRGEDGAVRIHAGGDVGDRAAGLRPAPRRVPVTTGTPTRSGSAGRTPSCRGTGPGARRRRRSRRCRRRSASGALRRAPRNDKPMRAAAPGARFCTSTSARASRRARSAGRLGVLEVERQALLAAVGPDEVRRQARGRGWS